jgi:hypothetical protein
MLCNRATNWTDTVAEITIRVFILLSDKKERSTITLDYNLSNEID